MPKPLAAEEPNWEEAPKPGLHSPGGLRAQAARCRRLAADVEGDAASRILIQLAEQYEAKARDLQTYQR